MTPRLPWWFTPAVFILVPVTLSMTAWTLLVLSGVLDHYPPTVATKLMGFDVAAPLSLPGVILLVLFYLFLAFVSTAGWLLGSARGIRPGPPRPAQPLNERRYFLLILAVAVVGVGFSWITVAMRSSIIGALSSQLGNQLYDSMPQNAGVQTLRYACILAAPLGVHLWRKGVIGLPLMIPAVLLLMLNALLSSRLSLMMAACVYLTLWVRTRKPTAGNAGRTAAAVLAVMTVGFLALTGLNYSRNANFYRELGVSDPIPMNLYQFSQYLSVPAQVSLGVADSVMTGKWHVPSSPAVSIDAINPTFLQKKKVRKADTMKYSADYGYSMTFAPQYFTNSVFADTYAEYGAWGWVFTFALYGLAGFVLARLMQGEPMVSATGGVIAYCFAEVWRIQIVSYGFVIFLVLLTAGGAWLTRIRAPAADPPAGGSAATAAAPDATAPAPPVSRPSATRHRR